MNIENDPHKAPLPAEFELRAKAEGEDYWEGIDKTIEEVFGQSESVSQEFLHQLDCQVSVTSEETAKEPELNSFTKVDQRAAEPHQTGSVDLGSSVVAADINSLRYKYVVGKIAGDDLNDHAGKVIIRKSEVISPEVVDRANREGKLAELIINMTIAGLGDDL